MNCEASQDTGHDTRHGDRDRGHAWGHATREKAKNERKWGRGSRAVRTANCETGNAATPVHFPCCCFPSSCLVPLVHALVTSSCLHFFLLCASYKIYCGVARVPAHPYDVIPQTNPRLWISNNRCREACSARSLRRTRLGAPQSVVCHLTMCAPFSHSVSPGRFFLSHSVSPRQVIRVLSKLGAFRVQRSCGRLSLA